MDTRKEMWGAAVFQTAATPKPFRRSSADGSKLWSKMLLPILPYVQLGSQWRAPGAGLAASSVSATCRALKMRVKLRVKL